MRSFFRSNKEKLDKGKPKIPRLNEDVIGIILKHVVEKQQRHILDTIECMREHLASPLMSERKKQKLITFFCDDPSPNHLKIEWPDYLYSNSRRLINHTKVMLFPAYEVRLPKEVEILKLMKTRQDLDLLWQTLKHFEEISFFNCVHDENYEYYDKESLPNRVFQKLWKKIQARTPFCHMLEERSH